MHVVDQILPTQGFYCAAQLTDSGKFIHRFFNNTNDLISFIEMQDRAGHTMYLAQASYKTTATRKTYNAAYVRNFFFDIDCGAEKFAKTPNKAYETQRDGCEAIKNFAQELGLPLPTVVVSGNGLYAHWCVDEDIPADKWKTIAQILKNVAHAAGFRQDPSRTSDASSVLRPVGTTNRKNGVTKPVRLLHLAQPLSFTSFTEKLHAAADRLKVKSLPLLPPGRFEGNDEFLSGSDGPKSSLFIVASKCAQVMQVRDTEGNVDEPTWYNFLGMARHTEEGASMVVLQEWSKGHPDYSPEATYRKVQQLEQVGSGPTTCQKFGADNPSGCIGCRFSGKVKSPILLGRPEPETAPEVIREIEESGEEDITPEGFRRGVDGLSILVDERWARFYAYDLSIEAVCNDATLGYEVIKFKHKLPTEDHYKRFNIRSALIFDLKSLFMTLMDNHVQCQSVGDSRKHMISYIEKTMEQIRAKRKLVNLYNQMGWQVPKDSAESVFVLGDTVYQKDRVEVAGFGAQVSEIARSFKAEGELKPWSEATKFLNLPGMEPFAFAFLAGAFGAPLLKFTGYSGAMVALVGDSGIGKTLVGEWIMSTYGKSSDLILMKDDTRNFLVQRLGLYNNLPAYIDEISNIDGQDFSDLVYRITQGRDKGRLTKTGKERENINSWSTIAVVSSNHSLTERLSALKSNAAAEINRVMEINVQAVKAFGRAEATEAYHTFHQNYGLAGREFVRYIVDKEDQHKEKISTLVKMIDEKTQAKPDERFWSAMAGAAIYGGLVAKKLGLIEIDVQKILAWISKYIVTARENKREQITHPVDVLGQFLDANAHQALVTTGNERGKIPSMIREPRSRLVYRMDLDTGRLYISRNELKHYLERTFGSYTDLKAALERCGALISADKRKVLGCGTYFGWAQQSVWELDLHNRNMGHRALTVVKKLEKPDVKKEEAKK